MVRAGSCLSPAYCGIASELIGCSRTRIVDTYGVGDVARHDGQREERVKERIRRGGAAGGTGEGEEEREAAEQEGRGGERSYYMFAGAMGERGPPRNGK